MGLSSSGFFVVSSGLVLFVVCSGLSEPVVSDGPGFARLLETTAMMVTQMAATTSSASAMDKPRFSRIFF